MSFNPSAELETSIMRALIADQPLAVRVPAWPRLIQLAGDHLRPLSHSFTSHFPMPQLIFHSGYNSRSWSDPAVGGFMRTPVYTAEAYDANDGESLAFRLCYLDMLQAYQRTDAASQHRNCRHMPEELPVDFSTYPQFVAALSGNFRFNEVRNSGVLSHRRIGQTIRKFQEGVSLKGTATSLQVEEEVVYDGVVYD
jgi:hypothetical protein